MQKRNTKSKTINLAQERKKKSLTRSLAARKRWAEIRRKTKFLGNSVPDPSQIIDNSIDSPLVYTSHPSGVDAISIAEHFNLCRGRALQLIWKSASGFSYSPLQDLEKAKAYLEREITRLRSQQE